MMGARLCLALLALVACGHGEQARPPWDAGSLRERALSAEGHGFTDLRLPQLERSEMYVLAWQVEEPEKSRCLLVVEGAMAEGTPVWALAVLYQSPSEGWRVPWMSHTNSSGRVFRSSAPSREDVLAFLAQIPTSREHWFDPALPIRTRCSAWDRATGEHAPTESLSIERIVEPSGPSMF
jgi:hypothetical protein